jgi:sugar phosphate permease
MLPYRYRVLILLFFLILVTYLDRICISLVGLRIKSEFQLSNEQFGWVLAAFSLAYALFEIPSGVLGDKIGQRAVLIRIVLWWSLFTALTGLATGLLSLILFRFLFGMGESGAFPTSTAVVSHWFPARETGRALSSLFLGQTVGAAIAPLIVVPIAAAYGWRSSFFVNGAIGVVWVAAFYLWFRNNPAEVKGITAKERTYIETNRRFQERDSTFPWRSALQSRSLRALVASFFCAQWGQYFFVAWMPVYLQEGKHFTENQMKTTVFLVFITAIVGILTAGFMSDWLAQKKGPQFSRRVVGMCALGGLSVALFATGFITNPTWVAACLITGYVFFVAIGSAFYATCIDIGGSKAGTVTGIMNFCGQTGAFFLALSFGKIADMTHNFDVPVFILSGVLLAGCLLWLLVDPGKPLIAMENDMTSFYTKDAVERTITNS